MDYTVKQLSHLAGVSIRTLHYYDQIGLLRPDSTGQNRYRYYGETAALRLQQILFFRELGFSLEEIKAIIDRPGFDLLPALEAHRLSLQERVKRLDSLIRTVDKTILHLKGKQTMQHNELYEGFSEEKQKQYEQEIRQRYGEHAFDGVTDWNSYTSAQKETILAEGKAVYRDLVAAMAKGAGSPEVQAVVARWHQHLRYFYEPSIERLLGLADLYNQDPRFEANFRALHPDLPEFMREAIKIYCKSLQ